MLEKVSSFRHRVTHMHDFEGLKSPRNLTKPHHHCLLQKPECQAVPSKMCILEVVSKNLKGSSQSLNCSTDPAAVSILVYKFPPRMRFGRAEYLSPAPLNMALPFCEPAMLEPHPSKCNNPCPSCQMSHLMMPVELTEKLGSFPCVAHWE